MAVVQGLFLYEWTFIAPMAFHTLWSWSGSGSPVTIAFFHRVTSPWIVIAGVAAVLTRGWLTLRAQNEASSAMRIHRLEEAAAEAADPGPGFVRRRPWLQAVIAAMLMTLLASGFMPMPLMAAEVMFMVAATLLARCYVLPRLSVWRKWAAIISKIPEVFRLAAAAFGTYWLTLWAAGPGIPNGFPGAFGAERVGLGLGLLLLILLLPQRAGGAVQNTQMDSYETAETGAAPRAWSAGRIGLGIVFIVLLAARKAYAQCMDPWCCCNGDNHWCALAASGYIPFFGGVLGATPRKRKKKKDPCAPIRGQLETVSLLLDNLLLEKQAYEEEAQSKISALQDQLSQIDQQLSALSAQIDKESQSRDIFQGLLQDAYDQARDAGKDSTSPEDVVKDTALPLMNIATWKAEIAKLEQQIADDIAKSQALNTQRQQVDQQLDVALYQNSNALDDFNKQEAELRRQYAEISLRLAKCEKAHHAAEVAA